MKVLVAVAHPDDECLMAGGTIAQHVAQGDEVLCSYVTDGVSSRVGSVILQEAEQRRSGFVAACKALGATPDHAYPGFSIFDNALDRVGLLPLAQHWEGVIEAYLPDIIYTHYAGDLNVDHRMVALAVVTATRPSSGLGKDVQAVYAGETPSSTEWGFGAVGPPFAPQHFVRLSDEDWVRKSYTLKDCYPSELREHSHPRSRDALLGLAMWRGGQCGAVYAEAFMVVRELRG